MRLSPSAIEGVHSAALRLAPVAVNQRLHTLDILRGLALFGMILVHFHQKMRLETSGLEDLIGWAVWVLVEQKAWGIFALLFGAGFAILLRRLEARRAPVFPIYLRRLGALALFGIVAEVGFGFHILLEYACWGLALLAIRHRSNRALLLVAALSACARPVASEISALHAWLTSAAPLIPATAALSGALQIATQQESYAALLSARWALFVGSLPHTWRGVLPDSNLALFTLGLLAVRNRVFDEPRRHVRLIAGWMTFGALSWAVSWLVVRRLPATPTPQIGWPLEYGLGLIQDQWLCFTYIGAGILLLAFRPEWNSRLAIVGAAGRMALTNYMVQVVVLDIMSSGYGAALKLRPYVYAPMAVLLFGAEALASAAWLARHRFGPLEWIWRVATYGRSATRPSMSYEAL